MRLGVLWLCLSVVLAGCEGRLLGRRDQTQRSIDQGDQLFASRADPAKLDEAIEVWLAARKAQQPDVRLLERLARAYLIRGYAHPEGTIDDLQTAREMAMQCVRLEPGVDWAVRSAGGTLLPDAVHQVSAGAGPCLLWGATAWARWIAARGNAGAAIDHAIVLSMAERATALKFTPPPGSRKGALGLALTLDVPPKPEALTRARELFEAATTAAPEELTWRVELATRVLAAQGDEAGWRRALNEVVAADITSKQPEYLENKTAQRRAREALDAGMPDPSSWWR